jgi:N-methylhydantoinase A
VIVPPEPGNFSAVGMLLADPRLDTAQTFVVRLNPDNLAKVLSVYAELETQGRAALRREFGDGTITIEREAEMRYKGQHHSIKIPLAETNDAGKLRARSTRNTSGATVTPIRPRRSRLVVLHSLATLHMNRPDVAPSGPAGERAAYGGAGTRPIFFSRRIILPTQVYDRMR